MIGRIYKLEALDKFYIGSTISNLETRFKKHKSKSNEDIAKNRKVYVCFKEIGWDNVKITLIKEVIISNRKELLAHEKGEIIKSINDENCLNSSLPLTTLEEKRKRDNEYSKKRRQENPERERERLQKWRTENPEKRRQQVIREHIKKNLIAV